MDPATAAAAATAAKAGDRLLDQGVLGIVIIGLVAAVVFLTLQLLKSFGERISDAVKQTEALRAAEQTAAALKETLEDSARARTDLAQHTQEMTRAIGSLEKTIEAAVTRKNEQLEDLRRLVLETRPDKSGR